MNYRARGGTCFYDDKTNTFFLVLLVSQVVHIRPKAQNPCISYYSYRIFIEIFFFHTLYLRKKDMKIVLNRINENFHFEAVNEHGLKVHSDGSVEIGGHNLAMRPMQMVLAALGSCSAIDVVSLLRKQRQEPTDIQITVSAQRETQKVPSLFTDIHVHYALTGNLDEKKVERAVNLSMNKLCSVKQLLDKTANITWAWKVKPEEGGSESTFGK